MLDQTLTPEQIKQHYSSTMDSVNLINTLKAKPSLTSDETKSLVANRDHIKSMLAKTFWTSEDLTPFKNAIK
jgi:hypothetical protein